MFGLKTYYTYLLQNTIPNFGGPSTIRINPTMFRCSHVCPMCWRQQLTVKQRASLLDKQKNELTETFYDRLLNDLPKSTRTVEIVGGGEPLLYKGIERIMKSIKSHNYYGNLITNGTDLTISMMHTLVNIHWDEIRISLHAASRATYRKIHGVDDFNVIKNNIQNLISYRKYGYPNVVLHYVLQHNNIKDVESFARLAESLSVDAIHFEPVIPYPKTTNVKLTNKDVQEIIQSLSRVQRTTRIQNNCAVLIQQLKQRQRKSSVLRPQIHHTYCSVVQRELHVNALGVVRPCCFSNDKSYGKYSVKTDSVLNIWWQMRQFRESLRKGHYHSFCKNCTYEQTNIPLS